MLTYNDKSYTTFTKLIETITNASDVLHEDGKPVTINRGVKKGDNISPKLITIVETYVINYFL